MPINVIELMNSVITDAQTLVNELVQNEQTQRLSADLLKTAQYIRTELAMIFSDDGSLAIDPKITRHNTRAPFGMISSSIYILKERAEREITVLSKARLERLEAIESKVEEVKNRLDELWTLE